MTVDVQALRERLRKAAGAAVFVARERRAAGNRDDFQFSTGRQAAFLTALHFLDEAEATAFAERDEMLSRGRVVTEVDLAAVARLEAFAEEHGFNCEDERLGEQALAAGVIGRRGHRVEQDTRSGRWYRLDEQGERLHGPYLDEEAARGGRHLVLGGGNPHTLDGFYATETGALDQASGTVYSDADGGL